jgi:hypothetical protein
MLLIDLSTVSDQQLRRLWEAARDRREPELAARVAAELRKRGFTAPRPAELAQRTGPRRPGDAPAIGSDAAFHSSRPGVVIGLLAAAFLSIAGAAAWIAASVGLPPRPAAAPAFLGQNPRAAAALAPEISTEPPAAEPAAPLPAPDYRVKTGGPVVIKATNCLELATPTDWIVCHDPVLVAQDRALWRAYYRVRAAAVDRAAARRAQIAWWKARNRLSNPADLANHYARRIRQLKAVKLPARAPAHRAGSRAR